jgi:hypothetical protein
MSALNGDAKWLFRRDVYRRATCWLGRRLFRGSLGLAFQVLRRGGCFGCDRATQSSSDRVSAGTLVVGWVSMRCQFWVTNPT